MKRRFDAFISYSHSADSRLAERLQLGLQRFAKPWYKLRQASVFRDNANLNLSTNLWESIRASLDGSRTFILLASPAAAKSPEVAKEIHHWITRCDSARLLLVITDGAVVWDDAACDFDWARTTCIPKALSGFYSGVPLYLDMTWAREAGVRLDLKEPRFARCVAALSATIHDKTVEDMVGEELAQHVRNTRWRNGAIGSLALLLLAAVAAAWEATVQQREANGQRVKAEQAQAVAEQRRAEADLQRARAEAKTREADEQRVAAEQGRAEAETQRGIARAKQAEAEAQRDRAEATALVTRVRSALQGGATGEAVRLALQAADRYPHQQAAAQAVGSVGMLATGLWARLDHPVGKVSGIQVSPDGARVATLFMDHSTIDPFVEARIYDGSGAVVASLPRVAELSFLDGGRKMLLVERGGNVDDEPVMLPDLSTCRGSSKRVLEAADAVRWGVAGPTGAGPGQGRSLPLGTRSVSDDGRRVLVLCGSWLEVIEPDGASRIAGVEAGAQATLSPNGQLVGVQSREGVRLIEVSALPPAPPGLRQIVPGTARVQLASLPQGIGLEGAGPVFSPDGRRVLTTQDGESLLWDTSGRLLARRPGNDPGFAAGERWFTRSASSTHLWDGSQPEAKTLPGIEAQVSVDRQWMLTKDAGSIVVFTADGDSVARLPGLHAQVWPLGPFVVTADATPGARVWSLRQLGLLTRTAARRLWTDGSQESGAEIDQALAELASDLARRRAIGGGVALCERGNVVCAPDQRVAVRWRSLGIGSINPRVSVELQALQQGPSGALQLEPQDPPREFPCRAPARVAFSSVPGGPWALGCGNGSLEVFSRGGQRLWHVAQNAAVTAVAWSEDGRWLVSAGDDGAVAVRDASDGALHRVVPDTDAAALQVRIDRHARTLAALLTNGVMRLWAIDGRAPRLLDSAQNEGDPFVAIRLSADGRTVYAASESGAFHRRALTSRQELAAQFPWMVSAGSAASAGASELLRHRTSEAAGTRHRHQPSLPASPLNGPARSSVTQPP